MGRCSNSVNKIPLTEAMADSVLHEAVERVHLTVPLHCCIRMECHKPQVLRGRRLQSVKLGITSSTAPFIEPESRRTRRIEITSSRKRMRKMSGKRIWQDVNRIHPLVLNAASIQKSFNNLSRSHDPTLGSLSVWLTELLEKYHKK